MIRFYNGKLLSLSGGFEISDWEVWVEETMILYVGPAIGAHPPFEREIDLKGNLLMPGFKNAHAHSANVPVMITGMCQVIVRRMSR